MKQYKVFIAISIFVFSGLNLAAQKANGYIRKGNSAYDKQNYTEAELDYRKAVESSPRSYEAQFNLGASLIKQKKFKEAAEQLQSISGATTDKKKLGALSYNFV